MKLSIEIDHKLKQALNSALGDLLQSVCGQMIFFRMSTTVTITTESMQSTSDSNIDHPLSI